MSFWKARATPRTSLISKTKARATKGELSADSLSRGLERRDLCFSYGTADSEAHTREVAQTHSPSSEGTGQASGDLMCPDLVIPEKSRLDTERRVIRLAERRKLNQDSSTCFPETL